MKIIKYKVLSAEINRGTEENPDIEQIFDNKKIYCSIDTLEANEEIATKEAYNGEYTIEDDGVEEIVEPTAQDDTDAMLIDHEYRLTLLELFTDITV